MYGHQVLLELNDPDELKRNLAAVTRSILRSLGALILAAPRCGAAAIAAIAKG